MAKRALIVDDSRSARVILSRMLEGYSLAVDTSESAEHALEYLRQNRPDVIFMDHLMPGMDGFQAVQAIKGNPATAMIPVVMYTSQEGELYLGQARALGAVGVLPKTVKQVDVSRLLYQLRLLPERREVRQVVPHATQDSPAAVRAHVVGASSGEIDAAVRGMIAPLLKEHGSEMRRFLLASFEAFARRITAEVKNTVPPPPVEVQPPPPPEKSHWPLAAAVAAVALLPTAVLGMLYGRTLESIRALTQANASLAAFVQEQQMHLATLRQALQSAPAMAATTALPGSDRIESSVPYGEAPLAGTRLEHLRELIGRLKGDGFRGKVQVATYIGEFCLVGNGMEGYEVASDELPLKRCDLVGNPFEDSLSAPQRQSLAFANLVSSVRQDGGSLEIEVQHHGREPAVPYPAGEQLGRLTAGEWNKIAARNNRVEFAAVPAGS